MWRWHRIIHGSRLVHEWLLAILLKTSAAINVWVCCMLLNIWKVRGSMSEWGKLVGTLLNSRTRYSLQLLLLWNSSRSIINKMSKWISCYPENEFLYSLSLCWWVIVLAETMLEFEFRTPPTLVPTSIAILPCSYALCEFWINCCYSCITCWPPYYD